MLRNPGELSATKLVPAVDGLGGSILHPVTPTHLSMLSVDPDFLEAARKFFSRLGVPASENEQVCRRAMPSSFFGVEEWIGHLCSRWRMDNIKTVPAFPWSKDVLGAQDSFQENGRVSDTHLAFLTCPLVIQENGTTGAMNYFDWRKVLGQAKVPVYFRVICEAKEAELRSKLAVTYEQKWHLGTLVQASQLGCTVEQLCSGWENDVYRVATASETCAYAIMQFVSRPSALSRQTSVFTSSTHEKETAIVTISPDQSTVFLSCGTTECLGNDALREHYVLLLRKDPPQ